MLKRTLLTLALISPAAGYGAVYQCEVNGSTVYSDRPCGNDAKELEHKSAPKIGGSMGSGRSDEFLEHRSTKRKVELIDREIGNLQDQRESVRRELDEALAEYRRQKRRANNNLAGAVWENSLAEEAQVQRERYQSEIDEINNEIERLRDERRRAVEQ